MQALKSLSILLPYELQGRLFAESTKPFLSLVFRSFSWSTKAKTQTPKTTSPISNYLITTFKFSKTLALSVATRFYWIETPEKPESVIRFLQNVGFSESHIRSAVRTRPQMLFSDVDKTLKPKIEFFQDLGLVGSELGKFISKNSSLLCVSLERKLVPFVDILKKVLCKDKSNEELIRVLRRCNWMVRGDPEWLVGNIAFLKSCGIVGSQLSMLLTRQPWLFITEESKLKDLVSRAVDMGFALNSRMLVHAVYSISCMSNETFTKKLELFRSSGFSSDECMEMFRKHPGLLRTSEEKLKLGIEFFMGTMKWEKTALISWPTCLMFSLETRVIARYKVMEILKSKRLLKRDPSFTYMLTLTEKEFLAKFITKFGDHAEELLVAYKGHLLDSSSEDKCDSC